MASDYGDEAGEKLFDWMLRMGQDASQDAIRASAEKLKSAIRNLRGQIDEPRAESGCEDVREYARLNLSEFEELPDYASLREIIDARLDAAAIEHDIANIDGHDHLIFKVKDAPEVDEAFKAFERDVDAACERAVNERGHDLNAERDAEPLEQKVSAAREASHAYQAAGKVEHEMERIEVKTR